MSSSHGKSQSHIAGGTAPAFPILMRMPDLRLSCEPDPSPPVESLTVTSCEPAMPKVAAEIADAAADRPLSAVQSHVASEQVSSVEQKKNASSTESVTPAAQRRQRALERQRRLEVEATPRSWWTSHAPVIAVGFLVALVVTVVMARGNREQPTSVEQARMDPPTPELEIEMGGPSIEVSSAPGTSFTAPPALIGAAPTTPADTAPTKPSPKLPELLSASPKAPELQQNASPGAPLPTLPEERVAAKAPVSEPVTPSAVRTSEFTGDAAAYPSTDAKGFGLNVPATPASEAESAYPSTSTPNSWR